MVDTSVMVDETVMIDNSGYEHIRQRLREHHQEHLLAFWPELGPCERQELLGQIQELDFPRVDEWIKQLVTSAPVPEVATKDFEPAPSYSPEPHDTGQRRKYKEAIELGEKLIAQGKVAALTVAGGQGTRLGFDGPKGSLPISPIKHKTLFRIFAETVQAVTRRYGAVCP